MRYRSLIDALDIEHKESFVSTRFGNTFVLEAGHDKNPAILLLHGSCSNSAMWFGDLKSLIKTYRVLLVDILGEPGYSAEARLDLKTDDYAHWLKEVIDAKYLKQVILVGNSFGGWMSLKFATTFPDRVSKLVLIATSGVTPVKPSFVLKSIWYVMQGNKGLVKLNQLVYGKEDLPQDVIEVSDMIMKNFNPVMGGLPNYSDEALRRLTMPVYYTAGEEDATVHVAKTAKRLEAILPCVQVEIIPNCGHVIYDAMSDVMPFWNLRDTKIHIYFNIREKRVFKRMGTFFLFQSILQGMRFIWRFRTIFRLIK